MARSRKSNTVSSPGKTAENADRYRSTRIDPESLMRIRNLQLRARVVVEGFYNGLHRSPFHGFSAQFSEYRQYVQGDDLRYVDWKLYARSDRFYIKRFEDETNLRCYLLVDRSRSMEFGSLGYTKAEYASTMAATLAYFLNRQRDSVGMLTFHQQVDQYIPARYRTGHFHRLLVALETPLAGKQTDLISPIRQIAELTRRRSLVVLISDLLADTAGLEKSLASLRSCGHDIIVFQVLDPAELTFEFDEPALFEDLETGQQLYVDPASARKDYLDRMEQHEAAIRSACDNHGIDRFLIRTDQPLEDSLYDFLQVRQLSAPAVRRHQRNRAIIHGGSR